MKVNSNDAIIRQEILNKILNKSKEASANMVTYAEGSNDASNESAQKASNDKVNISLSQYINSNLSAEAISAERQEKIARLKELYSKGEYKGAEAKELARSLVEGINEEIIMARNSILFDDEDL